MKRFSIYALFMLALMGLFVINGCDKSSPTNPDDGNEAIDQEFGGYSVTDENPDEIQLADFDIEDESVSDGVSDDPEMVSLMDSATINIYYVRITWGMLEWDSSATISTNWNGTATTNRGTLMVLKTVRFEKPVDYIVRPRVNNKNVQWVSETLPHFDGIQFAIVDNDPAEAGIAGEFTFTAGAYSNSFTFAELDSMDLIETVDNLGNQVSIISRSKQALIFAGGFLEGRWVRDTERGGHFWGRWIHSTGLRAGYLKGIWGVNRLGENVFFGKYISLSGKFGGLLAGQWGFDDETAGKGWFNGRWVNERLTKIGIIKGHFKAGTEGDGTGYFNGSWKRNY